MSGALYGKKNLRQFSRTLDYKTLSEKVDLDEIRVTNNYFIASTQSRNLPVEATGYLSVRLTDTHSRILQFYQLSDRGDLYMREAKRDENGYTFSKWIEINSGFDEGDDGIPVGTIMPYGGKETPPGYIALEGEGNKFIRVQDYPDLAKAVYCGDAENDTADFFYRSSDSAGMWRSPTGAYLALPSASRYFICGRDEPDGHSAYQYENQSVAGASGPGGTGSDDVALMRFPAMWMIKSTKRSVVQAANLDYEMVTDPADADIYLLSGNFYINNRSSVNFPVMQEGYFTVRANSNDSTVLQTYLTQAENRQFSRSGYRDNEKIHWHAWSETGSQASPGIRNVVRKGRTVNGEPAYLATHEFYRMDQSKGPLFSDTVERVSASSVYGTAHTPEVPLVNQLANKHGNRFISVPGAPTDWGFSLKKPQAFTMAEIVYFHPDETPQTIRIQATNEDHWDNPVEITGEIINKKFGISTNNVTRDWAQRYWFTDNTTAYKNWRIVCSEAMLATTHSAGFKAIRFFRHPDPAVGLDKNDVVLVATEDDPFEAAIAIGSQDKVVILSRSVVLPSTCFTEMSRNYIYLVPETDDGACPDYVDQARAVYLPGSKAWLVADNRKLNYGEERQLVRQCLASFRCDLPESADTSAKVVAAGEGGYRSAIYSSGVSVSEAAAFRGSKSAFVFPSTSGGGSYIQPYDGSVANYYQNPLDPRAQFQTGEEDFTIEVDLKYEGPEESAEDTYKIIFDMGYSAATTSAAIVYHHRRQMICIYHPNNHYIKFPYRFDDRFHTLSVSHRRGNIYCHVDGKCIGAYTGYPAHRTGYNYWIVGRWIHTNGNRWNGPISAFRFIAGDCLRQGEDYTPDPVFYQSAIPNRTLWYDHKAGSVKMWDAAAEKWQAAPMCPVGHVDTYYQEHLHSEAMRGTQRDYGTRRIKAITASGTYSGSYPPSGIFNFGNGNGCWLTPTNATTVEHWVQIELESPLAFSELRLCEMFNHNMWAFPETFKWEGSHDGETWTMLLDRTVHIKDGRVHNGLNGILGDANWVISGMKRLPYDHAEAFAYYRLTLPPKADIPFYSTNSFSGARLQLPLRGSGPDIAACQAYAIGGRYTYGPFMMSTNQEVKLGLPFGGAPVDLTKSYMTELNDWQSKRRSIGHSGNWSGDPRPTYGEEVYQSGDTVTLYTGRNNLSTLLDSWNSKTMTAASAYADYTIIAERMF